MNLLSAIRSRCLQPFHRKDRGSALVIVLLFVILLTGVVLAFLTRSMTALQVSAASANETKAGILADSASDIIMGDLRQEIIAGSVVQNGTSAPNAVYVPNANTYANPALNSSLPMEPFQSGVPKPTATITLANGGVPNIPSIPIPNLIRRSVRPSDNRNAPYGAPYTSNANSPATAYYTQASLPPERTADDTAKPENVSTATPSLNGRSISPAEWNLHYLLPRQTPTTNANQVDYDPTPTSSFVPPDWVIVTRGGATALGGGKGATIVWSPTAANAINNANSNNTNYAIGRYAYAIYDEGGLLDMNVAGYPSVLNNTPRAVSQKSSIALADLTQLSTEPVSTTTGLPVAGAPQLTSAQIDQIVGWRNYASLQASYTGTGSTAISGSLGNFNLSSSSALGQNWLSNFVVGNPNYLLGNSNGYMQPFTPLTAPSSTPTAPPTDQAFTSRQQLIALFKSLDISPDYLQYMGTFSRALEQPSYTPSSDPNRPMIINQGTPPPLPTTGTSGAPSYLGNNSAVGTDVSNYPTGGTTPNSFPVNPAFLDVRVTAPKGFTRLNGTQAVFGEPLVKYKFPLSRMAMVTYNALNKTLPAGFAATPADPDPIYDRFGLYRTSLSSPWVYNHLTITPTGAATNTILTLQQVSQLATPREPDFAELLKAAITAGSIGKGAPSETNDYCYAYGVDVNVDIQVLQIMANLIDQQDNDSYPTLIQFENSYVNNFLTTIAGVEDLPYLYRVTPFTVVDIAPQPSIAHSGSTISLIITKSTMASVSTAMTPTGSPAGTVSYSVPTSPTQSGIVTVPTSTTFNAGEVTYFYVPTVWNPHDNQNDGGAILTGDVNLRPTHFRICYTATDPSGGAGGNVTKNAVGVEAEMTTLNNTTVTNPDKSKTTYPGDVQLLPEMQAGNYLWPISPSPIAYTDPNAVGPGMVLPFSDGNGTLFREPTLLWNPTTPGIGLPTSNTNPTFVTDAITNKQYCGLVFGKVPINVAVTISGTKNGAQDGQYAVAAQTVNSYYMAQGAAKPTGNANATQFTFYLQYQDPSGSWQTYDVKFGDNHNTEGTPGTSSQPNSNGTPAVATAGNPRIMNSTSDFSNNIWDNPIAQNDPQFLYGSSQNAMDPRTDRFGLGDNGQIGHAGNQPNGSGGTTNSSGTAFVLEPTAAKNNASGTKAGSGPSSTQNSNMTKDTFSVWETARPRADPGNDNAYNGPCEVTSPASNQNMRFFGWPEYRGGSGSTTSPLDVCAGLFSQNNVTILPTQLLAQKTGSTAQVYYEDADGVVRRGMSAYADTTLIDDLVTSQATKTGTPTGQLSTVRIGMPTATANTYSADNGVGVPVAQSQSRPMILNGAFTSVAEMSYAFTGTPWKNIDFFTPESGDCPMLDVFCINDPPVSGIVAGKVDLNTRQLPVLEAMIGGNNALKDAAGNPAVGAYRDAMYNLVSPNNSAPPSYAIPPLNQQEGAYIAANLIDITADTTNNWRGPLENVSWLVGHYVNNTAVQNPPPDEYSYTPMTPAANEPAAMTFAGFSGTLGYGTAAAHTTVFSGLSAKSNINSDWMIQRMREAPIRALAAMGQVRVWNLLIDIVAQTGRYPTSATDLSQFVVTGQKHVWLHVAIDRYTGQVIDKQVEAVTQ